jgi:hypothetical protein
MAHTHSEGGPVCPVKTKAACDRVYADWLTMQQVLLAYKIALRGETKPYRKDKGVFAQLVRMIAGEQADIMNDDGNPSQSSEVKRIRATIEFIKAGELPKYNLYELPDPPAA